MGIGTMTRGEKAIIHVSSLYLTQSPFMPEVEGYEEVQFEVELVHFIQVCLAVFVNQCSCFPNSAISAGVISLIGYHCVVVLMYLAICPWKLLLCFSIISIGTLVLLPTLLVLNLKSQ